MNEPRMQLAMRRSVIRKSLTRLVAWFDLTIGWRKYPSRIRAFAGRKSTLASGTCILVINNIFWKFRIIPKISKLFQKFLKLIFKPMPVISIVTSKCRGVSTISTRPNQLTSINCVIPHHSRNTRRQRAGIASDTFTARHWCVSNSEHVLNRALYMGTFKRGAGSRVVSDERKNKSASCKWTSRIRKKYFKKIN